MIWCEARYRSKQNIAGLYQKTDPVMNKALEYVNQKIL